jgi:hypothetical protein
LWQEVQLAAATAHGSGGGDGFVSAVRTLASRVELAFFAGSPLLDHLNLEGRRILKSLLAIHWHLLNRIKENPQRLLQHPNGLSRGEMLRLRLHHWLGIEGWGIPLVASHSSAAGAPSH